MKLVDIILAHPIESAGVSALAWGLLGYFSDGPKLAVNLALTSAVTSGIAIYALRAMHEQNVMPASTSVGQGLPGILYQAATIFRHAGQEMLDDLSVLRVAMMDPTLPATGYGSRQYAYQAIVNAGYSP